ncbi:MAG: TonB-dependent receptor [Bacteroidota bacterium]
MRRLFALIVLGWIQICVWGQSSYLTIVDQQSLRPISNVAVSFFNQSGLSLHDTISGIRGRVPIPLTGQNRSISCRATGYIPLNLTWKEVELGNYRIFLEKADYDLREVVLTAKRHSASLAEVPYHIQVISAQDIAESDPQNTADLLAQQGQVFVQKSQQGGGSPNLRGFEANKVLLVIDGVRMNNAIYRSGHLQNVLTIDPDILDRAEVFFGPGSLLYGSDALGGVMHFVTRNPALSSNDKILLSSNASTRYSSVNQEKSLHGDLNIGLKKWGFLSSFSLHDFGDLRVGSRRPDAYADFGKLTEYVVHQEDQDVVVHNPDPNLMRGTAYRQWDALQKISFTPNNQTRHLLNLQYSTSSNITRFDRLTQRHDGQLRFAEWYYGPQKRFLASYQLKRYDLSHPLADFYDVHLAWQNIEESRINRNFGNPIRNHRIENVAIGSLNIDAEKSISTHTINYGLEAVINDVQSGAFTEDMVSGERGRLDTRYPDGGTRMHTYAAYATHQWNLSDQWILHDGLRWSAVSLRSAFVDTSFFTFPFTQIQQQNQAISGMMGLVWENYDWRASLNYSSGFRAPNLDDVAKVFDSQPGNVVVPNADLMPEYTHNVEISLRRHFGPRAGIEVNAHYTWYLDAIVLRTASLHGADSIFYEGVLSQVQQNVNARSAFITGANLNAWWKMGPWRLRHSMTFTYGQELETNVPMDHIPPFFGKTSLGFEQPRFQVEVFSHYNGWKRPERYSPRDEANAEFATADGWPAWWTLNAQASYTLHPKLSLQMGVDNLLDQHYRVFSSRISSPGRNIRVSLRSSF